MKTILKIYLTTNQARIFTALVLTGILSIGSSFTLIKNASAAPANLMPESANEFIKENIRTNNLPRRVASAVRRDASRRTQISLKELEIVESNPRTWNNGCLGLSQPAEVCTQALVPGWRVVVSDGKQNWIYHTNSNGRLLRIASAETPTGNLPAKLPESLKNAVFQAASRRLNVPISQLNIVQAKPQTWNNGCLDIFNSDEVCSAALVPGWRVVVGAVDQTLVYHTNASGSVLRLNEKASEIADNDTLTPVSIPASELPPPLNENVIFRQISSGGFAGRTYETVLLSDGRLMRYEMSDVNDPERQVWQISPQQVRQFQQLLEKKKLREFRNLSYPAANGSADYITYTITTNEGTVRYNDVSQNNLPKNLRTVIKAWNQIRNTTNANQIPDDIKPLPIPVSELPPPLNGNVVFRQISSGGLFPRTYETVLLSDGRLIRYQIGDANDSQRQVWRISPQQVRQFQQLLEKKKLREFRNLSYPAANGSADYITYTITTNEGTVRYNDVSQNNLPKNLRTVIKAWNQIRNTTNANQIPDDKLQPLPIPVSELPPPLNDNVIFRQISSGGFAGKTYETVLLNDGRLMRYEIGDANDSQRRVWRISPQQVRQFQQLLEEQRFDECENLSYPATNGSADYITYTVTSDDTTIRYNDISQNNLPKNLQAVVKAWNQIRKSYQ